MSSDRPLAPQANALERIASDLLAQRAKELVDSLFDGSFTPIRDGIANLRSALDTYSAVRTGEVVKDAAADPQRCTVADWERAPETERSTRT